MTQTDPKQSARAQAVTADRASVLGQGSAPIAVALMLGLPLLIWGVTLVSALLAGAGKPN